MIALQTNTRLYVESIIIISINFGYIISGVSDILTALQVRIPRWNTDKWHKYYYGMSCDNNTIPCLDSVAHQPIQDWSQVVDYALTREPANFVAYWLCVCIRNNMNLIISIMPGIYDAYQDVCLLVFHEVSGGCVKLKGFVFVNLPYDIRQ